MTLVRPTSDMTWELRAAWGKRRRVSVSLDDRCQVSRIEGEVDAVAGSGAFVVIDGWHIPSDAILAVHRPSRLGDSTVDVPKATPRCIVCQREVKIDKRTQACHSCAAELGVAA